MWHQCEVLGTLIVSCQTGNDLDGVGYMRAWSSLITASRLTYDPLILTWYSRLESTVAFGHEADRWVGQLLSATIQGMQGKIPKNT